ncbi:response regulator [Patescibacteria group bacterium]
MARILVFDREIKHRALILKPLKGHTLRIFGDLETSLNYFEDNFLDIDLIIADFELPMLEGLYFSRLDLTIKKVPIILVTTTIFSGRVKNGMKMAGIVDVVTKPLDKEIFLQAVNNALKNKEDI